MWSPNTATLFLPPPSLLPTTTNHARHRRQPCSSLPPPFMTAHDGLNNAHIYRHFAPWTSTTTPGHPRRATSPPRQPPPSRLWPTSREPFGPHLTCQSSTTTPECPHPCHHHGPVNYDAHHQWNCLGPTLHAEARQPHQNIRVTTTAQSIMTPTINRTV